MTPNLSGAQWRDFCVQALGANSPSELDGSGRPCDDGSLFGYAAEQGVTVQVYQALREVHNAPSAATGLRNGLREEAYRQVSQCAIQARQLAPVLEALSAAGIRPLLFKGVPLAYSHYSRPYLRPRCDTDMMVRHGDLSSIRTVLISLGFQSQPGVTGDLISHQQIFIRRDASGYENVIDLHWKISNPHIFSGLIDYEELLEHSVPVPQLGLNAFAADSVHALLIACIHRVAHHHNSRRLIWLYDIFLLANSMSDADVHRFGSLAIDKGIIAVCRDGLDASFAQFATNEVAENGDAWRSVRRSWTTEPTEATTVFLRNRSRIAEFYDEVSALPDWRAQLRLVGQHLWPNAEYMRSRYPMSSSQWLPYFYAKRVLSGLGKWLGRPRRVD